MTAHDLGCDDSGRPYTGYYRDADHGGWDTPGGYPPVGRAVRMRPGGRRAAPDAEVLHGEVIEAGPQGVRIRWTTGYVGAVGPDHFDAIVPDDPEESIDLPRHRFVEAPPAERVDVLVEARPAITGGLAVHGSLHVVEQPDRSLAFVARLTGARGGRRGEVELIVDLADARKVREALAPEPVPRRGDAVEQLLTRLRAENPTQDGYAALSGALAVYQWHADEACPLDIRPGDPADDTGDPR